MKKTISVFLLFGSMLFATSTSDAIDSQKDLIVDGQDILTSQKNELNNIIKLDKDIIISQQQIIYELQKQTKLVYLRFLAEAEVLILGRK